MTATFSATPPSLSAPYTAGGDRAHVSGVTADLHGDLWFTETFADKIGRLDTGTRSYACARQSLRALGFHRP